MLYIQKKIKKVVKQHNSHERKDKLKQYLIKVTSCDVTRVKKYMYSNNSFSYFISNVTMIYNTIVHYNGKIKKKYQFKFRIKPIDTKKKIKK